MSYIVLARKWRPKRFAEMVGQEHVLRALGNALDSGKVHHAFLFTGTRGVGKTTIARILAKSLNCETAGVSSNPCGICAACREIDEGRFVDLIEVDAASRTKVDDTREMLDNVQYAPTRGRFKVYLIDEVHMLSNHSFNALLKTLEEPPPHIKFLLATTDPQKLPVTVLSRCLQFSLKRLPAALIGERLKFIADAEHLQFDPAAVALLARAAEGSMRDALSLLDQLIAFGAGALNEVNTRAMLGTIDRGHVGRLIDALARADGPSLLAEVKELDRDAPDYDRALVELAAFLQRIAIVQIVPEAALQDEEFDADSLTRLAQAISPEDVQLYYQIALGGRRDLAMAPDPRMGFEMTLLRMLAFRPDQQSGSHRRNRRRRSAPSGSHARHRGWARGRRARGGGARCRGGECLQHPVDEHRCAKLARCGRGGELERHGAPVRLELRAGNFRARRVGVEARSSDGGSAHAAHRGQTSARPVEVSRPRYSRHIRNGSIDPRYSRAPAPASGAGQGCSRSGCIRGGSRGQGIA